MKDDLVIVTGGAGFIGSHLCEKLVDEGFEVWSVDNYFTGSTDNHVEGVTYFDMEAKDIMKLLPAKPKYVFHLGEYSRVEQSFDDIDIVWDYNTKGIQSVLKFCHRTGAKLIYAGSSTKFADDGEGPTQSPYAFSKSTNTNLVNAYSKWFGIDYATVYFYNVFGGREIKSGPYATVVAKFKELAKQGKEASITLPGTQLRNFTYIDDIVDGLIRVAYNGQGDEHGIGNPRSYTIVQLAELFGLKYQFTIAKKGNRMGAVVVGDKLDKLGWKPTVELEDYIKGVQ